MIKKKLFNLVYTHLNTKKKYLEIAVKNRAKFEGWLKYEIAYSLYNNLGNVEIEKQYPYKSKNKKLCDLYFIQKPKRENYLELKTVNTSYKVNLPNVKDANRPITKNVMGVIQTSKKLKKIKDPRINKIILFAVYPLTDEKLIDWKKHERKINKHLGNVYEQKNLTISKKHNIYVKIYLYSIR